MIRCVLVTLIGFALLAFVGCAPSIARFSDTMRIDRSASRLAQQPVSQPAPVPKDTVPKNTVPNKQAAVEKFDNYNDDASDAFLTRQVNKRIEREILEEARRREQAEAARLRAEARWPRGTEQIKGTPAGHFFPWNTLLWGGLGAAIGSHDGHSKEGAAIGAGVGLLMDLARWSW